MLTIDECKHPKFLTVTRIQCDSPGCTQVIALYLPQGKESLELVKIFASLGWYAGRISGYQVCQFHKNEWCHAGDQYMTYLNSRFTVHGNG